MAPPYDQDCGSLVASQCWYTDRSSAAHYQCMLSGHAAQRFQQETEDIVKQFRHQTVRSISVSICRFSHCLCLRGCCKAHRPELSPPARMTHSPSDPTPQLTPRVPAPLTPDLACHASIFCMYASSLACRLLKLLFAIHDGYHMTIL